MCASMYKNVHTPEDYMILSFDILTITYLSNNKSEYSLTAKDKNMKAHCVDLLKNGFSIT